MTFIAGPHDPNAYDVPTSLVHSLTAELARMREALARVTDAASCLVARLPDPGPEAAAAIYLASIELRRAEASFDGAIAWTPIAAVPPRIRDGRKVLLWLPAPDGRPALSRWSAKSGTWLEGDDLEEGEDICGTGAPVPSHYAEILAPEGDRALVAAERTPGFDVLLRQVEEMVQESGDPVGFDAADWLTRWLATPMPGLGGKRPGDYMGTEEGRGTVATLLEMARNGTYA